MKRIGLTQRVELVTSYGERRDCLDQEWSRLMSCLGYLPVPIPNAIENVEEWFSLVGLEGVILTGGNDLSCLKDAKNTAPERDSLEHALIDLCGRYKIPLLGVCRGMQILNVHYEGTLTPVKDHVALRHDITFDGCNSNQIKLSVNSFHNYGIVEAGLGSGLIPWATDQDGHIEAVKHRDLAQFGIMWHPERETPFVKEDLDILTRIFEGEKE